MKLKRIRFQCDACGAKSPEDVARGHASRWHRIAIRLCSWPLKSDVDVEYACSDKCASELCRKYAEGFQDTAEGKRA